MLDGTIECEFISGAANTSSNCVLWAKNHSKDIVAFGADNLLCIVDSGMKKIVCTLRGHTGSITNLAKILKEASGQGMNIITDLVSSSTDGTVRVWTHEYGGPLTNWTDSATLRGLNGAIIALNSTRICHGAIIAASDESGCLMLWIRPSLSDHFVPKVSIKLPQPQMTRVINIFPLISNESQETVLIVLGCLDGRIRIRAADYDQLFDTNENEPPSSVNEASLNDITRDITTLSGHEDWVTCVAVLDRAGLSHIPPVGVPVVSRSHPPSGLLVASGSQDSRIRLWAITTIKSSEAVVVAVVSQLDEDEDEVVEGDVVPATGVTEEALGDYRAAFTASGTNWSVSLDALLIGHEDWVTSVHWIIHGRESSMPSVRLFSTSMDRNMLLWGEDAGSGVWSPLFRMGDIGGSIGGAVGGNLLGFVDGCVSPDGEAVVGVGFGGAFHLWTRGSNTGVSSQDAPADTALNQWLAGAEKWRPEAFLTGHFREVCDLSWHPSPDTPCLVSVSADQTCRLFAPLAVPQSPHGWQWRELSRPQIHGYDINAVAMGLTCCAADGQGQGVEAGVCRVYSGGDEKVVRVLEAPLVVMVGLQRLAGISLCPGSELIEGDNTDKLHRVHRAYIPELTLSAKASALMTKEEQQEQAIRGVGALSWTGPPLEGQLADHTLWPEMHKLFGHGGDVLSLAASPDGRWLASSCKARDAKAAVVLLWSTSVASVNCVGGLSGHESSVTALRFSPDSRLLVSAGKCRSICLFSLYPRGGGVVGGQGAVMDVAPTCRVVAAHKRIVWDCSWTGDSSWLVSCSRDGVCKVWRVATTAGGCRQDLQCVLSFSPFDGVSVTSLDLTCVSTAPQSPEGVGRQDGAHWLLAVGAESGDLQLWRLQTTAETDGAQASAEVGGRRFIPSLWCHGVGRTVRRVRWAPSDYPGSGMRGAGATRYLATCGDDHCVRIFSVTL